MNFEAKKREALSTEREAERRRKKVAENVHESRTSRKKPPPEMNTRKLKHEVIMKPSK